MASRREHNLQFPAVVPLNLAVASPLNGGGLGHMKDRATGLHECCSETVSN